MINVPRHHLGVLVLVMMKKDPSKINAKQIVKYIDICSLKQKECGLH